MRNKFIKELAIVGLAAIFLLSMSSNSPAKKGGKPPELYKVTISINDIDKEDQVPGLENADMIIGSEVPPQFPLPDPNFDPILCQDGYSSLGYFYAERQSAKDLLRIESEGSATPGPDDDPYGGDLNMWVKTGIEDLPIILEGCPFDDGCHSENEYSKIVIRFLTSQDDYGTDPDIVIHLWVDYEAVPSNEMKGSRKRVRGFRLRNLMPYDEVDEQYPYPVSTNLFPKDGLEVGGTFWTDVIGPFVLLHDGKACPDGIEGENFLLVLPGFNIRLFIERVR